MVICCHHRLVPKRSCYGRSNSRFTKHCFLSNDLFRHPKSHFRDPFHPISTDRCEPPNKSAKSFPTESSELVERNCKDAPTNVVWGPLKEDTSWNCVEAWTKNHQTIPNLQMILGGWNIYASFFQEKSSFKCTKRWRNLCPSFWLGWLEFPVGKYGYAVFCWVWNLGAAQAAMATFLKQHCWVVTGCDRVKRREVRSIQCLEIAKRQHGCFQK